LPNRLEKYLEKRITIFKLLYLCFPRLRAGVYEKCPSFEIAATSFEEQGVE